VDPAGDAEPVAGHSRPGFDGDGGPARDAHLLEPASVAVQADGDILIADSGNDRIRLISRRDRTIRTVAGAGTPAWMLTPSVRRAPVACGRFCGDVNYDRLWSFFYLTDLPLTGRAGRPLLVRFVTSRRAAVVLEVLSGGRQVRRVRRDVGAGRDTLHVEPLPRGRYEVRLTGDVAGDVASDEAALQVR
jgi:hypothetical protein